MTDDADGETTVESLARELGVSTGRLLDACDALQIQVDGRSSRLTSPEAVELRSALGRADTAGPDAHHPGGTRREARSLADAGAGTRREGPAGSVPGDRGTGWSVHLPTVLAERFELVRQLRQGGEGFVLLVRPHDHDGELVVKGYYAGLDVDTTSLEVLARETTDLRHVVRIHEYGQLPDGGFYEVQEYCPLGSLRELMQDSDGPGVDLQVLIKELTTAVAHVHALGIIHRDVKPENILVRSVDPLDLVVTDFGLVRRMDGSVRRTTRAGTVEYSPPEGVVSNVDVTTAWDWWSVGMVIAEVAAGAHPLALPDGSFPDADETRAELAQRSVPLDGIADDRVRLLCSGLLVRDRRRRWGVDEIDRWQAGESPEVDDVVAPSGPPSTSTVRFAGEEYRTPPELAAAFQRRWSETMSILFQDPDPALVDETVTLCRSFGLDHAADLLGEKPTGGDVVRQLTRLLVAMDPAITPEFDGLSVTPAGLEQAATLVLEEGDRTAANTLAAIERSQVLRTWRRVPNMDDAAAIDERWGELRTAVDGLLPDAVKTHPPTLDRVRATLLLRAIDTRHFAEGPTGLDDENAREVSWWTELANSNAPGAELVAVAALPQAVGEGSSIREARHQQEAEELERQRHHRAQELERAHRERQELERRLRLDDLRVLRRVAVFSVLGFPVGLYRLNQETHDFPAPVDSLGALFDAAPGPSLLAVVLGGAVVGPLIGVATLVARRRWDLRRTGLVLALILGVAALVLYAVGGSSAEDAADSARQEMLSSPLPENRFSTCGSASQFWTGSTLPTRTFVDEDCRTVRSYDGWFEEWSWRAGGDLGDLISISGYYLVLSQDSVFMTALDGFDGSEAWTETCRVGFELDERQFDQGPDTPSNQRLLGSCGNFPFNVDPATGRP